MFLHSNYNRLMRGHRIFVSTTPTPQTCLYIFRSRHRDLFLSQPHSLNTTAGRLTTHVYNCTKLNKNNRLLVLSLFSHVSVHSHPTRLRLHNHQTARPKLMPSRRPKQHAMPVYPTCGIPPKLTCLSPRSLSLLHDLDLNLQHRPRLHVPAAHHVQRGGCRANHDDLRLPRRGLGGKLSDEAWT